MATGWASVAQTASDGLKLALRGALVLALPDFDAWYAVVCDDSGFGCGAALLQQHKPVASCSYKLNDAERRCTGEQELLIVIVALRQWRCCLSSATRGMTMVSDH